MSEEKVELTRSALEAYNTGIDEYLEFVAEDVEVRPDTSVWPEAEALRGRDEFRRLLRDIHQSWDGGGPASEIEEIFPVGNRVVVRAMWGGRGRASGVDLRTSLTTIATIRDGEIAKVEFFFDHSKALAAAGLGEGTR